MADQAKMKAKELDAEEAAKLLKLLGRDELMMAQGFTMALLAKLQMERAGRETA